MEQQFNLKIRQGQVLTLLIFIGYVGFLLVVDTLKIAHKIFNRQV